MQPHPSAIKSSKETTASSQSIYIKPYSVSSSNSLSGWARIRWGVKSEKLLFYPNGKHSSFVELSLARSQVPSYCVRQERESRMVVCIARQIGTLAHHSSVVLRRPSPPSQTSSTSPSSSSSFFFTVSECFRLSSPSSASRNGFRTDKGGPRNGMAFPISRDTVCHHRSFNIRTAAALSQGASAGEAMDSVKPFGVLFVCLGECVDDGCFLHDFLQCVKFCYCSFPEYEILPLPSMETAACLRTGMQTIGLRLRFCFRQVWWAKWGMRRSL